MPTELTPELIDTVRCLSDEDRDMLLMETDPEVTDSVREAWRMELARRVETVLDGSAKTLSLEESIARLEAIATEFNNRAV